MARSLGCWRASIHVRRHGYTVGCAMMAANVLMLMRMLGVELEVLGDERLYWNGLRAPVRFVDQLVSDVERKGEDLFVVDVLAGRLGDVGGVRHHVHDRDVQRYARRHLLNGSFTCPAPRASRTPPEHDRTPPDRGP